MEPCNKKNGLKGGVNVHLGKVSEFLFNYYFVYGKKENVAHNHRTIL